MKERKEQFQKLLEEAGLHGKYVHYVFFFYICTENGILSSFLCCLDHRLVILLRNMEGMNDLRM